MAFSIPYPFLEDHGNILKISADTPANTSAGFQMMKKIQRTLLINSNIFYSPVNLYVQLKHLQINSIPHLKQSDQILSPQTNCPNS